MESSRITRCKMGFRSIADMPEWMILMEFRGMAQMDSAATGGFVTRTAEIECLDATAVMTSLASAGSGYIVTNVSETRPLDGPVTFTLTAKKTS